MQRLPLQPKDKQGAGHPGVDGGLVGGDHIEAANLLRSDAVFLEERCDGREGQRRGVLAVRRHANSRLPALGLKQRATRSKVFTRRQTGAAAAATLRAQLTV